jgi:undecaprenyl-diphosphatase
MAAGVLLIVLGLLGWAFGSRIDHAIHHLLHVRGSAGAIRWVLFLTDLGGAAGMNALAALAAVWLVVRRQAGRAVWLFVTIAVGRLLVELAKAELARPRPPVADHLATVTNLSFPSGHAAGATMTCVALCLAFAVGRSWWIAALIFALAIGLTRVALGVHWSSDVLAGWGFGLVWPMLCARWLPARRA